MKARHLSQLSNQKARIKALKMIKWRMIQRDDQEKKRQYQQQKKMEM